MKFLVVDDDPIIQKLLAEILVGFGYDSVRSCGSGYEALRMLQSELVHFDCMMLDIQMPEMDGIELCRAIRSQPGYHSTPIIMITVLQDISYIRSAFAAGATDYTVKPFDVIELVERIRLAEVIKDPEQARQMAIIRSKAENGGAAIDSLVSRVALENYVRNCRLKKLITPAALTVRVNPIGKLQVNDIAEAVVNVFGEHEVFMSYVGQGEVILVCDRFHALNEEEIKKRLMTELSRMSREISSQTPWDIETGGWAMPRPYERASDMSFLNRAINERKTGWWELAGASSRSLASRLLGSR